MGFGEARRDGDRSLFQLRLLDASSRDRWHELGELLTSLGEAPLGRLARDAESLELGGDACAFGPRAGDLPAQGILTSMTIRGALFHGAQAIPHLGLAALAFDVCGLRLIHLGGEESHSTFRLLMRGLRTRLAVLSFAIVAGELVEGLSPLIDLGGELADARRGLLTVPRESRQLLLGFGLLAIEHLETRGRVTASGASFEQRLLAGSELLLRFGQPPPRRLAFTLVKLDRRDERRFTITEGSALCFGARELGVEASELAPCELQLDGPQLLLPEPMAGAGTGKTRTLTARVARLLADGADPSRVLLLTFTRRAAADMLARAAVLCGDRRAANRLWGGTFHAVAHRLIIDHADALGLPAGVSACWIRPTPGT